MPVGDGAGTNLGHAQGSISISTAGVERVPGVTRRVGIEAERNLGRVSTGAAKAQASFAGLTSSVVQMGAVMGVSLGVAGAFRLFQTSVKAASDLTEAINKVGVAFGDSGDEILTWSENSARALGQSRQQALEAASSFGLLFTTMGLVPSESAEMSMALVQLATDMASINNISIDEALIKLRAGLVGEVEPLRTVGVLLNAAAVEARAMEMGLAESTDAITEQDKVMARYQLILEQTRLTQGDFERTSGDLANQQRITAAAAADARAAFGDMIVPATLAFIRDLGSALDFAAQKMREFNEAREEGRAWGQEWFEFVSTPDPSAMAATERVRLRDVRDPEAIEREQEIVTDLREEYQRVLGVREQLQAMGDSAGVDAVNRHLEQMNRQLEFAEMNLQRLSSAPPITIGVSSPFAGLGGTPTHGGGVSAAFPKQKELEAAQLDYWQAIQEIDRDAHSAIQDATEQYGRQRASTVAQFEKSIARESEDFARQRARAVADHEAQIADIRQDAAAREVQWAADLSARIAGMREDAARRNADTQADHEERIAELRADGAERLLELEESTRKARERAERQHRDTLLNAASRLDARAVAQEMRRWATAGADQEQALKERVEQERENLAERIEQEQATHAKRMAREARDLQIRIDQEQAAHAKRIADARAADEARIADAQEAFDERIAQEDEDRAIRLGRQRKDHDDQLGEMARAQGLRIQQIKEQQAEQRAQLDDEFEDQLEDLGGFNMARINEQKRFKTAATKLFDDMWGDWYMTMEGYQKAQRELAAQMGPHPKPLDYPSVLDPSSLPSGYNPAASTRSTSITVASGAITVHAAPGQSPTDIADEVDRQMIRRFNEIGGQ